MSGGGFSYEELQEVIETHIANVVGHYAGQCYHWDVVNEAADDSGEWRSSVFYDTMGTDFLAISFNAAKAADPNAKLYVELKDRHRYVTPLTRPGTSTTTTSSTTAPRRTAPSRR